jgi:mRNA interferase RelE/StbE
MSKEVICMSGIQFVVDDKGAKKAVVIDLKKFGDVWEDFYDTLIAEGRVNEPRESLPRWRNACSARASSMAEYAVIFARSARRELESLENATVSRIFAQIESLSEHPRPRDGGKLRGRKDLWRLRVGDYRVIYAIDDAERIVDIVAVRTCMKTIHLADKSQYG